MRVPKMKGESQDEILWKILCGIIIRAGRAGTKMYGTTGTRYQYTVQYSYLLVLKNRDAVIRPSQS